MPFSQINWIEAASDAAPIITYEYPIYTDAWIRGEFTDGLGPYSFHNTVPPHAYGGMGTVKSSIILRAGIYCSPLFPDDNSTDESHYHGGTLADELASLVSLSLGIRARAGGESRQFKPDCDPYGRPCAWRDKPIPFIQVHGNQLILPSVAGKHEMSDLALIKSIPQIPSLRYVELIRASRLYQDALWVVEADPNLAWLMFVSALEVAANDSVLAANTSEEILRTANPTLVALLEQFDQDTLVPQVAELIAPTLKATKKFIDFSLKHMPPAPPKRPSQERFQVSWSTSNLKKLLSKIYGYRSRSLHAGLPFPAPMFDAPSHCAKDEPVAEVPRFGLGVSALGGTWKPEDLPINLHCFHYIVRGALLDWSSISCLNDIQDECKPADT